ncbi:MAG TPA: LuxR C-terminal-related transcriptional regulator, partial [Nocardioidaceae bacterium]
EAALGPLRKALGVWVRQHAPYLEARARLLLAECCRGLGDDESGDRELAASRAIFRDLGAAPDLARVDAVQDATGDGKLTVRELEVLRLLATGSTNKAIAASLVLSERTVDRHVSNIYMKLGVSTRAAATAYAFERHLV